MSVGRSEPPRHGWEGRMAKRRNASKGRRSQSARHPRARAIRSRAEGASPPIRLLVADDQAIDRAGLVAILGTQPDFAIVGEASTTDEAIRGCLERRPMLLILSLSLPSSAGTALSGIRGRFPEIPILAVAQRGEAHCMVLNPQGPDRGPDVGPNVRCTAGTDCLELAVAEGAAGTIRRSAAPEDLFGAIRAIASGKAWFEAGTAAAIMRHALARQAREGAHRPLSKRELEVSRLIADGRSNKEIAQALEISEPTVKKHVGHILAKLSLQDRLQVGIHFTRNPLLLRASASPER